METVVLIELWSEPTAPEVVSVALSLPDLLQITFSSTHFKPTFQSYSYLVGSAWFVSKSV